MDHAAAESPYTVLRNRNFLLFLIARFIASLGQQMLTVAVGWELYERTGSALALGLVGLIQILPMFLFTLPAGHVADNYERKGVILIMTLLTSACSVGLAMVSLFQAPVVWVYLCLFVSGSARTFVWPASASFLPQLVSRRLFPRAVTWNSGSFHLSSVAGPAVGGVLIAWTKSAAIVYAFHAAALLVCFGLMVCIRLRSRTGLARESMTLENLVAGFRFVFTNQIILGTITLDLFAVLFGGATALLPVYAKDILHVDASGLGLLQAALPVGALACAVVLAHRPVLKRAGRALLWSVALFGVATIGFGLSTSFWFSLLMLFVAGAMDNISVVVRHTLVQMLTPDEKRGRVSAVNSLFIGTSNELGGFESGTVAHWFGPVFSVVSGGIATLLVVAAVAWAWPQIRRYGSLDGSSSSETEPQPDPSLPKERDISCELGKNTN